MSKGGTIHNLEMDLKHIVPVDDRDRMLPPHRPTRDCVCKPKEEDGVGGILIVHNDHARSMN
jgi:hypothetical protein